MYVRHHGPWRDVRERQRCLGPVQFRQFCAIDRLQGRFHGSGGVCSRLGGRGLVPQRRGCCPQIIVKQRGLRTEELQYWYAGDRKMFSLKLAGQTNSLIL